MIARLEERFTTYPPTAVLAAVVALTAAILALLPGVAEAQEQQQQQQQQGAAAPATAPAARSAVVAPGDSLWSICQERLGPSASAQQVALDVRRIHEISRNLIGDDPDLIFPGQRLALPPPDGVPAAPARGYRGYPNTECGASGGRRCVFSPPGRMA